MSLLPLNIGFFYSLYPFLYPNNDNICRIYKSLTITTGCWNCRQFPSPLLRRETLPETPSAACLLTVPFCCRLNFCHIYIYTHTYIHIHSHWELQFTIRIQFDRRRLSLSSFSKSNSVLQTLVFELRNCSNAADRRDLSEWALNRAGERGITLRASGKDSERNVFKNQSSSRTIKQ